MEKNLIEEIEERLAEARKPKTLSGDTLGKIKEIVSIAKEIGSLLETGESCLISRKGVEGKTIILFPDHLFLIEYETLYFDALEERLINDKNIKEEDIIKIHATLSQYVAESTTISLTVK